MRQKLPCLLLSGALALSLCACAPAGENSGASLPPTAPPPEASVSVLETSGPESAPSVGPSEAPTQSLAERYGIPDREYQPWQEAYMDFLTALRQAEQQSLDVIFGGAAPTETAYDGLAVDQRGVCDVNSGQRLPMTQAMEMGSDYYSLYDVDRDGVPELFVCYDYYTTQCYTFRDGQIVCICEFNSKDSSLYTHPEHPSVLRHGGRMGHYEVYEYSMEGGRLTEGREIFSEGPVDAMTETGEIVPGAEQIPYFYTYLGDYQRHYYTFDPEGEYLADNQIHASAGKALLLPIADWQAGPAATGNNPEQARTAILAVLAGDGELYGASGDHSSGDVGRMAWEDYIQPGAAFPYSEEPLEITRYAWLDMNGDGQEELLLMVVTNRGEDNGEPWTSEATVVLSEQEGTVYAYLFGLHNYADDFYDDSSVWQYSEAWRLSFWKGQCYEYIARRDAAAQPVKWLDGAPAG